MTADVIPAGTAHGDLTVPLRDLTDEEFRARYRCDRFTASVLASRFRYAMEHVCTQLVTYAFSPVIRESTDISAAISGPPSTDFAMPAVAQTIPIFFGSIADAVRNAVTEYGVDQLAPGDVLIVNDPARVGTHLNDVCFIRPVFFHDDLIGAVTIRAHMLDWGGRAMGGFEVTKANLYEDGLVLGPMLLYRAGVPVRSTFNLILDNTRFGPIVVPDIQTINSSLELGERLLVESATKYGVDAYLGGIRYACDASAETMGSALERLPDGVYQGEEWLDGDGLGGDEQYVVRATVTKRGGVAEVDLSGTAPSTGSAVNCSWADAKTAVSIALKYLVDPTSPFTSGSMRHIDILVPPDSMVNAQPPHSTMFYWEPVLAIIHAVFRALNPVLGPDALAPDSWGGTIHMGYGQLPDGRGWFSSAGQIVTPAGPWGGTKTADGDSGQLMIILNLLDGGAEQAEADNPVVVMRRDYVPDTAGPGLHRSGAASVADSLWLAPGSHRVSTFHARRPPGDGGVQGGRAGTLAGGWMWDPESTELARSVDFLPLDLTHDMYGEAAPLMGVLDPATKQVDADGEYYLSLQPIMASANTVIRFVCNGAGGWGPALERDPHKVLIDVRDEYVTIGGARRDYGVVVTGDPLTDPEGLSLDVEGTELLRSQLAAQADRSSA